MPILECLDGLIDDGDVRAGAPDLVALLAVPPPPEHVVARRQRPRDLHPVHDLQVVRTPHPGAREPGLVLAPAVEIEGNQFYRTSSQADPGSGHQFSCCLVSLRFLWGILQPNGAEPC